ncbi:MAG: hypothetical protein ED557_14430 [Balneola sp.]|nr:MAG: hypothetical protein ED557_14430 [Balneola sp.]
MKYFLQFALLFTLLIGCTNNDAQSDFERQAFGEPNGITQTDENGNIIGDPDSDDWRTSPFYAGLAEINPIFPNPVLYGSNGATLDVFLNGTPLTSVLELGYFDFQNRWTQVQRVDGITDFSQNPLIVSPASFGSNASLARGTYRLVLLDGNQRVITYGDIEIE